MAIKTSLGALRYNNRMYRIWNKCKEANAKHKIIIRSLHDAIADCTECAWHYAYTGAKTSKELELEHKKSHNN